MKNRRTQILINPKFQIRFVLFMTSWIIVLSVIFPMIVSSIFENVIELIRPVSETIANDLKNQYESVMTLVILFEATFVGASILLSLFASHRIAGPLYKLNQFLNQMAQGEFKTLKFRESDYFQELADSFNKIEKK